MSNFSAVLVGINKYQGCPLNGCVNDIIIMRDILVRKYKVPANQIRLVLDDRATKANIEERLSWLATNDSTTKLFYYSGHGAQIPIQDYSVENYEPDSMDELLCPVDFNWEGNYITDNQINNILCTMSKAHHMTMVFDCCHSGTIGRNTEATTIASKSIPTPLDLLSRVSTASLSKDLGLDLEKDLEKLFEDAPTVTPPAAKFSQHNISILTGCQDGQTSADAWFSSRYQGALSYFMQGILMRAPNITLSELRKACELKLTTGGFTQTPQLISDEANINKPFIQI